MTNPGMQDLIARYVNDYCQEHRLKPEQAKVIACIRQCRTPALGGLQWQCDACDYQGPVYHSCRHRHCPQCQKNASAQWCERQRQSVLPTPYFHVVFTLPHELNGWVELHPEVIYHLLFQAVWATLKAFGADPKRLGGQMGMTAVLHTWGQNLSRHVHLHCLVPGGALSETGQWIACKNAHYLFPDKALARYFRGRYVSLLRQAQQQGKLHRLTRPHEMKTCLDALMAKNWIVYTKSYFTQADTVVAYLGRYTHRIAISDQRLVNIDNGQVSFRYKDYQDQSRKKVMVLDALEFIRRFLLHVLPAGLMRIRHYGFLANRCREKKLALIRQRLDESQDNEPRQTAKTANGQATRTPGEIEFRCPQCRTGVLKPSLHIAANAWPSG